MKKELTKSEAVLKTLKRRKGGFTDGELVDATGIASAAAIRSKLVKAGLVQAVAVVKIEGKRGRPATKWAVVSA